MAEPLQPCMFDNQGRRVEQWLPHMQAADFLRAAIARGERTDECWAVLKANHERVRAGQAVIAEMKREAAAGVEGQTK
jgi:hypothetical protein